MVYTENGLKLTIDDLRHLLERVENEADYNDKIPCIYITGGDRPQIVQYGYYAECNQVCYTTGVRSE